MDKSEFGNGRKVGAVKAAINMYGGGKANQIIKKPQNDASSNFEKKTSKGELHLAKNRINQIKENRITVDSEKSEAEFKLLKAKKLVRELNLQIEGSKLRAKEYRKGAQVKEQLVQGENDQYEKVARELEVVKRELSKVKLEIECAVEEKDQAEKEADAAESRLMSYTRTAEKMRREIEEANEEEVLVELAQIQARKELAEIEAQRKEEWEKQLFLIQETRKKISALRNEVETMKDLESLLVLTNRDVEVLQYELNLIKEMDNKIQRSQRMMKKSGLQLVTKDLEEAKKELEVIKKGGIQLMGSMDVIRNELINITSEKSKIEKMEAEKENSIKKLNLKLHRANDKLEVARASEEEAKLMLPSFSITLEKLEKEKEEARKEEEQLKEETNNVRSEIQKIESETDANEKRLEAAIEELEKVRSLETTALEKLQAVAENAVRERALKRNSTITITKFEYEYLKGCAAGAQEVAEKKVAAADAWVKALMADEKEMKTKSAVAEKNIEELKLKEAEEVHRVEKAENEAVLAAEELQKRRLIKDRDYSLTPVRQAKFRRSVGSPGTRRMSASTSFNIKRRRKAMLRSAKYFANDQVENEKSVTLKENTDN